jgi:hypothetical protein
MPNNFEAIGIKKANLILEKNLKKAKNLNNREKIVVEKDLSWWQKIKLKFLG